jgi:hypothetical protein
MTLLGPRRKQPTQAQRRTIREEQQNKCLICGDESPLEFDHYPPLRQLMAGQAQTFRGLCHSCHREVTDAQGPCVKLESRFSPHAWNHYVMSPRAPPLVWQPEKPGETDQEINIDSI